MLKIYSHFSFVNSRPSKSITNGILARTKNLTLSSKKYHKYVGFMTENTQKNLLDLRNDSKLPEINLKPLKKNNNSFLKSTKTITPKIKEKIFSEYNTNLNPSKRNKENSSKNFTFNKKKNIFICDLDYSIGDLNEKDKNNFDSYPKSNRNNYSYHKNKFNSTHKNFPNQRNMFKTSIGKGKNRVINFTEEKISQKQIFCLLDSVFTENKKNENKIENKIEEKIYDENNIFGYKDIYLEFLKDELTSLTKNEKQINMKSQLSYAYYNKIYGKIIMELNSTKIEVINKNTQIIQSTVYIPFSLLCLIYLSSMKQISYIILNIFKNDCFLKNEATPNMLEIFEEMVKKLITYKDNALSFENMFENQGRNDILSDYLNYRNLKYRNSVRYNFLSLNLKAVMKQITFEDSTFNTQSLNSIFDMNYNYNAINYNKNLESSRNLFDSNINIYNLSWITHNKNYNIRIIMPQIVVKLPNYEKQINHFIDKQLLLYLYKNNFKDWNFYISHYLFTLKKFRSCINNILSYFNLYKMQNNNLLRNFIFNTDRTNSNQELYKENTINFNSYTERNNIIYENYNLSNLKFEQYENSLNDNEYIFLVSDDEYIHLYKMKSYVLYAYTLTDLKNPKIYFFDFTFYQMKILFYKSKYENLGQFLQKLIKVNKEKKKIYLDYYYFTTFRRMNEKQINDYFNEGNYIENLEIVNNNNINDNLTKIIVKDLILKVINPKFISVSIKKIKDSNDNGQQGKWEKKEGEIGEKLIKKLVENDIKNWGNILWQNKDSIEVLKINKVNAKKFNFFKGKKDFKAVFKKFLKIK